jgi:hypothetical protein
VSDVADASTGMGEGDTDTDGGASTSTTTGSASSSTDGASSSTTAGSTTDASTSLQDDGESGSETTGPCAMSFVDSFAGEAIGPHWLVSTDPAVQVAVTNGHLVFTFGEALGWGALSTVEHFDVSEAEVLFEVEHFAGQPFGTELNLSLNGEGGVARFSVCCGSVYAQTISGGRTVTHATSPWNEPRYLRLRTADDTVHFEVSDDSTQWASLATAPAPLDLSDTRVVIQAGVWEESMNPGYASIDSVEICAWPS